MITLGLTGPIASGKSNVEAAFKNLGALVLEADTIVHLLQQPKTLVTNKIAAFAGHEVLADDGSIDRVKLGSELEKSPLLLNRLERIIFPVLKQEIAKQINATNVPLVLVSAPLLFQAKIDSLCDTVALCVCKPKIRKARALKRQGMTKERFELYNSHQLTDLELAKRTQHHIPTDVNFETTCLVVKTLYNQLTKIS